MPGLPSHRKPADWRDLDALLTRVYFHEAAIELGEVHAFTLNLRPDVEVLVRGKASAASNLLRRIGVELRKVFGEALPVWFALEETDRGRRLHLHGEIVVGAEDAAKARAALRIAAGVWDHTRQHQAHTALDPDLGWVSYGVKANAFTTRKLDALFANLRQFKGENGAATQSIRREAKRLYEADRLVVIARKHK